MAIPSLPLLPLPPLRQKSEKTHYASLLCGMGLLALASIIVACLMGSVSLSLSELWQATQELFHGRSTILATSLLDLRLSRALSGFVIGATLSLSGVLMQALLRNPLADPYVLGLSGGASVGALSAMLFLGMGALVDMAAFVGALTVATILFVLAYRDFRGSGSSEGSAPLLLLTGVVVATGCGAIVTLLLSIAPDWSLRGMVFWMIGDLSNTQPRLLTWGLLLGVGTLVLSQARAINVAAMHADNASTLGVNIGRLRQLLFFCAALLTATAVSSAGSIGFVGLIIPHACRFAVGSDHRILIPMSVLSGGSFLVVADALARTVVAPYQLPVGVITALIGVPVFLFQLHYLRRH
ncbi:MAG: iron ABC transporter permease [Undibacterium sp.]|nr:iron ABC transporter permease [Undibacterium sp.]